jgi:osmotically-inducible protein OsmY
VVLSVKVPPYEFLYGGIMKLHNVFVPVLVALSSFSLSGCLLAAGAAGAEAGYVASQDNRSAGQTIDDQMILSSIKTKMLADPDVSGLKINVDVNKGRVTLRGYVESQHEVNRAMELARRTGGVVSVDNRMIVDSEARARPKL